jgi:hypothetical protein
MDLSGIKSTNVQAIIDEYEGYLNLTANENTMSLTAKKFLSTIISDRYYFQSDSEGYSDFPNIQTLIHYQEFMRC